MTGYEQDRGLLNSEYQTRVAEYAAKRRETARQEARRKGEDTFDNLYKEAAVRSQKMKEREDIQKEKVPVDCTFQPNLSRMNTKPQQKGKDTKGKKEKPRYLSLYAKKQAERDRAKEELQRRLKEQEEKFGPKAIEAATPKRGDGKKEATETAADVGKSKPPDAVAAAGGGARKSKAKGRRKGIDEKGRFIKFDKEKHREQVATLDYLRQQQHCTFSPRIKLKPKGPMLTRRRSQMSPPRDDSKDVVDRLLKDGEKRRERKKKRSRQGTSDNNCTFQPQITAASKSLDKGAAKRAAERLYTSGQEALRKKQTRHKTRPRPTFKPDLSATSNWKRPLTDEEKQERAMKRKELREKRQLEQEEKDREAKEKDALERDKQGKEETGTGPKIKNLEDGKQPKSADGELPVDKSPPAAAGVSATPRLHCSAPSPPASRTSSCAAACARSARSSRTWSGCARA